MKQAHIPILKSFDDLRFNLGKKTLIDFLKGNPNPTIDRNNLDELNSFGCLYMLSEREIEILIDELIKYKYLDLDVVNGHFKVVIRTNKGIREILERKFEPNSSEKIKLHSIFTKEIEISDAEKKLFAGFSFFLDKFNLEQKKAIVSNKENILVIAGAGSGKTTTLTKRIEFLTKFKSVKQNSILAITFTKKAKEEMILRLKSNGIENVCIETFNSFSEKILQKYEDEIYKKKTKVIDFKNKILEVKKALDKLNIRLDLIADEYFNKMQLRQKSRDELFFIFVNDIFSIIDFYKNLERKIEKFYEREKVLRKRKIAKQIYDIAVEVENSIKSKGFRDFSDQVLDVLNFFRKNPKKISYFDHVLVDEFQDVNLVQFELLKIINKKNLFAVGDPRQAIYGWRGSDIKYILDFYKYFKNCEIINLNKNYRSDKQIVDLFNLAIKPMGLVDLKAEKKSINNEKKCFLVEQSSEIVEKQFVLESIKSLNVKRSEIFVLARTNRQLEDFAEFFRSCGIKFAIKSEEEYKNCEPSEDEIVLATVHSIKGMEAEVVYLVGANSLSFPNRAVDNAVFALVKEDFDYDKEAEELRLFYVALSRAKSKLIISYTGNYTKFITNDMLELLDVKIKNKSLFNWAKKAENKSLDNSDSLILKNMLKDWRSEMAKKLNLPNYMIISNKAIDDLVSLRPQTKAELFNVNGLGEVKIAKYSEDILKIING